MRDLEPWRYFLTLERDVINTASYVEPHIDHAAVFSDRYAGLLLLIGSEVDVAAKTLSRDFEDLSRRWNMADYRRVLMAEFPHLPRIQIRAPLYSLSISPFLAWAPDPPAKLRWWESYNAVKHDRYESRSQATQSAVLHSLAALFILHKLRYGEVEDIKPYPELLTAYSVYAPAYGHLQEGGYV